MIKTAEAGVQGIVELLREMKELAINSANDSNSDEDRRALQKEFAQRIDTINDIALSTQFNGKRLIDGTYETKMMLEEIIVGWKKSNLQSFTLAPNRTNEKVLYIDGSRVVTTENNVKNLTRSFTPVNSTIKDILTKSLLKSWTTPRLDCDTGFDGARSTWNWADAYNQKILAPTSGTVTTVFDGTDTTPSTPQQVMKAFMSSLDETTLSVNSALNEAINYSTGGKFATKDALVNQFMSDLNGAASYTDFLSTYCGIDLTNADTGAITGSDAGGSTTKTAESIVPEQVAVTSWGVPTAGSTTTIAGLTVHWPTRGVNGTLSDAEKHILAGLNSDWINQSLQLVKDSYGIDFNETGTSTKDIYVKFEETNNTALAYVTSRYSTSTGKTTNLDLVVNMKYYKDIDTTNENGALDPSSSMYYTAGYLDRTIAHEFTHAVMSANIDNFSSLPMYIKEGTAELTHGIDDVRTSRIINLLSTSAGKSKLQTIFSSGGTTGDADPYAAGYVLLRYLAKQGAGQTISKTEQTTKYSSGTTVPRTKETGVAIDFSSATGTGNFHDDFHEQGFSILCGGCAQYINIVFDKNLDINQSTLKTYSNDALKKDYRIGIRDATGQSDLGRAIFEGIASTARSSADTKYDVYVKNAGGTEELVCVSVDQKHNLRIAKNPYYDSSNPTGDNSEYIFLKENSPSMLFIDSGTILATGGKTSDDDLPQGTITQTGDNTRPQIEQINVTTTTPGNVWEEEAITESVLVYRYRNLVIHDGMQAGQHNNYYIKNMQPSALTAGQLVDDADELIHENDRARYEALSHDSDKQTEWLKTLKAAENLTVDDISVANRNDAHVAIRVLDGAIEYALGEATTLGAYLQRLESSGNNIETTEENATASESIIRDTDLAKEMVTYTRTSVLMMAAQSMLAQANQNTGNVLSLLREEEE